MVALEDDHGNQLHKFSWSLPVDVFTLWFVLRKAGIQVAMIKRDFKLIKGGKTAG